MPTEPDDALDRLMQDLVGSRLREVYVDVGSHANPSERGRERAEALTVLQLEDYRPAIAAAQLMPGVYHPFTAAFLQRVAHRLVEKDERYCPGTLTEHVWLRTLVLAPARLEMRCGHCDCPADLRARRRTAIAVQARQLELLAMMGFIPPHLNVEP